MPTKKRSYASKSSSASKRATYGRPVKSGINQISMRPSGGTRKKATFIYFEEGRFLQSTAGVQNVTQFNLTSLFDPDRSGAGHQPVNFDQLMAIYEQYVVYEAEYKVIFRGATLAGNAGLIGCGVSDDVTSISLDFARHVENGSCQWGVLDLEAGSPSVKQFTGKVDIAKAHGITMRQLLTDDRYKGTASTSPADQIVLNNIVKTQTGLSNTDYVMGIEIRYHCYLEGSKLNTLS